MTERILCSGNDAVGWASIYAGCKSFFGYPITPQNEIAEFMSRELPKRGGVYLQSAGEAEAAYMLFGGSLTGERVMTATSSPGLALMQEAFSHIAMVEAPVVVVDVMRLGPGAGTGGQQGQTDYRVVTKGVFGGLEYVILAPNSIPEIFQFVQLAFHIADKYRIMVMVITDFLLGRMSEFIELKSFDFGPLPKKDWGLMGKDKKNGRSDCHFSGLVFGGIPNFFQTQQDKFRRIAESEMRYEIFNAEDAELLIVSYGSLARISKGAVNMARAQGLNLGLFRPITLRPFPKDALREQATRVKKVLVVEIAQGNLSRT
ncbi:MAG: 3-methyl-2-oxobutanoate dehydrogenase subunit beta [Chloroflexota bacterium]|nr:3-methyl-2-oxobutanoate dehydrogenase subunit beta [Chloroflexota bacterium]